MISLQLTYNLLHSWKTVNNISVIGSAFSDNQLLKENSFIDYFEDCKTEEKFVAKIQKLDGHFSAILEIENKILIAADAIRTFPIFYHQHIKDIIVTDKIQSDFTVNEKEIENLKNVYCTLENNTLLKNWHQLQAGEYVVIDKTNTTAEIKTYYHHSTESISEAESEITLQNKLTILENKLIKKTIQYANNRTIFIPLSGGYDSRYLLALLKQNNYAKIECFTYGKKNSYEVLIAKNVAEKLNVKWHFIEYTDELLETFFTDEWQQYSDANHHFSSLPHEQDFFALHYLKQNNLLPENAVIINGFCQDIHAGSFIEPIHNFDLQKFIFHKHYLKADVSDYENSWNGYQEWLVKNRLSKFIVNSVRMYEYFHLDFYLPFWNKDWIDFWYGLDMESRLNQKFYNKYLFDGIFKQYNIDFKKPSHDATNSFYTLKKIAKSILPKLITKQLQFQNNTNKQNDVNNSLYLYDRIYDVLDKKTMTKDFKINNIHAVYFLEKLREKYQL